MRPVAQRNLARHRPPRQALPDHRRLLRSAPTPPSRRPAQNLHPTETVPIIWQITWHAILLPAIKQAGSLQCYHPPQGGAQASLTIHRTDQTILHHPGLEKGADELENALVRHPRRGPRHQAIVIDPVEEFFEIKIGHDAVALCDVELRLGYRLVGGSPRPEAVAVLGERRVPPLLKNLQQSLLDQSVDDARDAEFANPAIGLGYFDPLDRSRLVGSRE